MLKVRLPYLFKAIFCTSKIFVFERLVQTIEMRRCNIMYSFTRFVEEPYASSSIVRCLEGQFDSDGLLSPQQERRDRI